MILDQEALSVRFTHPTKWRTTSIMPADLTHTFRGRLGLLRKSAQALALLIVAATAGVSLTAAPADAASWRLYQVYADSETCNAVGEAAVYVGKVKKYKCLWDSPGFGLWFYS
ncbi:hypothetical protein [Sphaerisporangium rhizosphaerae]|uniref:Uncharacterized protein n=1 Tax=Sphaerisporangium rhizosphaerae TaxID=2269375 RepID=A0ABW2PF48_9ACTN